MDLRQSLDYLLDEEGGWSNHPSDRGGATFNGVTQKTYDDWRSRIVKKPKQSVRQATADEIQELYEVMYWKAARCDTLPSPFNYLTFDAAVNSGPDRAARWLQAGLGVAVDGKIGPQTRLAAEAAVASGDASKILAVVQVRADFLCDLVRGQSSQLDFLKGWWRRTLRVLARSLV